jgi:N-acetylmuramoyl-L-alanine amidase
MIKSPSSNFNDRRGGDHISLLIMHYTGMQSGEAALERLIDPASEVSAHYLVMEDGTVHQLVADEKRAWHAGVGSWQGETDINSRSIGIEIVNPGHEFGYRAFPAAQMVAVKELSVGLVQKYGVEPINVIGHSDIAPIRKQDPGELFDWKALSCLGVGLWPSSLTDTDCSDDAFLQALSEIGYDVTDTAAVITAFQRHWRPDLITGQSDEECRKIALSLKSQLSA